MKRIFYLGLFISGLVFISSGCLPEDESEQQRKDQETALSNYLKTHGIKDSIINGIYFIRRDTITGAKPSSTDYVLVNYSLSLLNDNLIETNNFVLATEKSIEPSTLTIGPVLFGLQNSLPGIREGLKLLNEGDSAVIIIPSDMALGSGYSEKIPAFSNFIYKVRLVKIIPKPKLYDHELYEKMVIDSLQLTLKDSTKNGNYYRVTQEGEGDTIQTGQTVTFRYNICFADGRYFNNSNKLDSFTMLAGANKIIPSGIEDVILHLKNKSKAKCVIPYYNAYGANGYRNPNTWQILIPVYTSLYYNIEIRSVK